MPIISIRKWQTSDIDTYFKLCHETEVRKYFNTIYCKNIKEVKALFKSRKKKEFFNFLIEDGENTVGVIVGNPKRYSLEISYFIGKEFRRNGYCVKAITALQEELKNSKYKAMHFKVSKYNFGSLAVMKKIGATYLKKDKDWIYYNLEIEG